jgi:hypothetical protein
VQIYVQVSILPACHSSPFVTCLFVYILSVRSPMSPTSYIFVPRLPMAFQNEPRFDAVSPETRGDLLCQHIYIFSLLVTLKPTQPSRSSRLIYSRATRLYVSKLIPNPSHIMATSGVVAPVILPLNERPIKNTICLFDVDGTLSPARLVSRD